MGSHFMAAPTRQEMGCVGRTKTAPASGKDPHGSVGFGQPQLTTEQQANLATVMARQAASGGGHLTDTRHLGDMPDYRH